MQASGYKTKQKNLILVCLAALGDEHVTPVQIFERLRQEGTPVGLATVYRHLDRLAEEGRVKKYVIGGVSGACYQYVRESGECACHFHLKCEACGRLIHLKCSALEETMRHVSAGHNFQVNFNTTVIYGLCENCPGEAAQAAK